LGARLPATDQVAGECALIDKGLNDHSRLVVGHRFGFAEDTVRLAAALKPALDARGIRAGVYVDNGSVFLDAWLLRACAKLGIQLVSMVLLPWPVDLDCRVRRGVFRRAHRLE